MKQILCSLFTLSFLILIIEISKGQDPDPGIQVEAFEGDGNRPVFVDSMGRFIIPSDHRTDTTYNEPLLSIPDNDCAGIVDSILVSGLPTGFTSAGIRLNLDISHSYNWDLIIFLITPSADTLNIAMGNGGNSDNYHNVTFSDFGDLILTSNPIIDNGHYKPASNPNNPCSSPTQTFRSFSQLGGGIVDPNGAWYLYIMDRAALDLGTLNSWSLIFNEHQGVQNYMVKWDAEAPLGQAKKSSIYDDGLVGIGTEAPTEMLDVDGEIRIRGGSPSTGDLLMAVGSDGKAEWSNTVVSSRKGIVVYFPADYDDWGIIIDSTSSLYLSPGDHVTMQASCYVRLDQGSGADDFWFQVVMFGLGNCSDQVWNLYQGPYRPPESSSDHDNYHPVSYLDFTHNITCAGAYKFRFEVRNNGDDAWSVRETRLVVRKN